MPSEDVLTYTFETADHTACAIVYADGIVNKQWLGDLIARPLSKLDFVQEIGQNKQNEGTMSALKLEIVKKTALFPELKEVKNLLDMT